MDKFETYKKLINESLKRYYPEDETIKYYGRLPNNRYQTFKKCLEEIENNNYKTIVELGTSRSFVDGAFEGCNLDDTKYWDPTNPEKWDWSAGLFTYVFSEAIQNRDAILHTVDLAHSHIERCKVMTNPFSNKIKYHVCTSEDFLSNFNGKIDLLYLDTGDMTPIEPTAELHLREAKIIVERNLLSANGIILIDDVRNITPKKCGETSDYGKAKYSLPYFLQHGYEILIDEYQVILQKKKSNLKILHLSFHHGCQNDIEYVAKMFGCHLEFMEFDDGVTKSNAKYNIDVHRANRCWEKYKDYFNSFDVVITSDTAPIARVFLQNNFDKKLIIWICNRFDYCDMASLDCNFPDEDYYNLFRNAQTKKNIIIAGYTPFENYYAKQIKNVDVGTLVIKPIGKILNQTFEETNTENKRNQFFVPPYHNDTIMMNLSAKLSELNISHFNGRYNGGLDLKNYKGIIHIPYAWSNFALFEGFQLGIIYFIPSKSFLIEIKRDKNFYWTPPYIEDMINMSEWYLPEHQNLFVFFDSWDDLRSKTMSTDYNQKKEIIKQFADQHEKTQLDFWKSVIMA